MNQALKEKLEQQFGEKLQIKKVGEVEYLTAQEGKIRQFMVTKTLANGDEGVIKMNLTLEEAYYLSKENQFYGIANMYNWFSDHDCKLSPDSGCPVCELLYNIK